jgi:hypothetical protein
MVEAIEARIAEAERKRQHAAAYHHTDTYGYETGRAHALRECLELAQEHRCED